MAYDDNADGKTDRVALNTYDANGNLVNTEYHNDGVESNPENRVETNRYDANGNLVQKAIDANGDGQVDTIETYTVNDKGQITGTSYADANGNVYKSETYVLDNNGNWLEKHANEDGKANTGNDQGVDRIEKYELNAKGEAIKVSYDNNADGNTDAVEYRVLDANGNEKAKYYNTDNTTTSGNTVRTEDGRTLTGINRIEINTLDAKGRASQIDYDNNADGTADTVEYFVRNANGNVTEKYFNTDNTDSGNTKVINGVEVKGIDKVETYVLNAKGQAIQIDYDNNADGTMDKQEFVTVNENGNWLQTSVDSDGDGIINWTTTYQLNPQGKGEVAYYDTDADGKANYAEHFKYDSAGNVIYKGTDSSPANLLDDVIDKYEKYTLDPLGRIIATEYGNHVNGEDVPTVVSYFELDNQNYRRVWHWRYVTEEHQDRDANIDTGYAGGDITHKGVDLINKFTRGSSGEEYIREVDNNVDGAIDYMAFGGYNYQLDMTNWTKAELSDFGDKLNYIRLSGTTASTELTLDKATIAAISQTGFQVRGDATDTVKLTDITAAEKLTTTTKSGGQDYNQYQFEVEGTTYTLLVDTDINVVLG